MYALCSVQPFSSLPDTGTMPYRSHVFQGVAKEKPGLRALDACPGKGLIRQVDEPATQNVHMKQCRHSGSVNTRRLQ